MHLSEVCRQRMGLVDQEHFCLASAFQYVRQIKEKHNLCVELHIVADDNIFLLADGKLMRLQGEQVMARARVILEQVLKSGYFCGNDSEGR